MGHIFNWEPSPLDERDFPYTLHFAAPAVLPKSVDLRSKFAAVDVFDQGDLGSCTANAAAGVIAFVARLKGSSEYFSRLFIYYKTRHDVEKTGKGDNGATLRGTCKACVKYGAPSEVEDPYVVINFDKAPTAAVSRDGAKQLVTAYYTLDQPGQEAEDYLTGIKGALANGHPIMGGMEVNSDIESAAVARTGVLPFSPHKAKIGGHALVIVGYDDAKSMLLMRNSWGKAWGQAGYFWMSYQEVLTLNWNDSWVITDERIAQSVTQPVAA